MGPVSVSPVYHPQTQGLTEQANQTTFHSLKHYLNPLSETWEHLVAVEFACNMSCSPGLHTV